MRRLAALVLLSGVLLGAKAPEPSCSWSPAGVSAGGFSTMTAINLPDRPIAVTFSPYPNGVSILHDGTYELTRQVFETTTVYIWTRGGGGALFKPGRQLNDYHPIAMCTVVVS